MEWSAQTNQKIRDLFNSNKDLRDRLLSNIDEVKKEAIREIGAYSNTGFTSEEIVNAYKAGKIDELYKEAERKTKIRVLYYELIGEEPPKVLVKSLEK